METKSASVNKITHPFWNLALITLPQVVMCLIFINNYTIVETILAEPGKGMFDELFYSFLAYQVLIIGLSVFLWLRKSRGKMIFHIANILATMAFLYIFSYSYLYTFSAGGTDWMFDTLSNYLLVLAFTMPAVILSFYNILKANLARSIRPVAWKNFLLALAIPAGYYILFRILLPLLRWSFYNEFMLHLSLILLILSSIAFYFLLFRGIFILIRNRTVFFKKHILIVRLSLCLGLPLASLLSYNLLGAIDIPLKYLVGDFNHILFYVFCFLNGVILSLPEPSSLLPARLLRVLRLLCFPFSLYFALVFLPYLPISIILIAALGSGLLMLSPLALVLLHTARIKEDFHREKAYGLPVKLTVAALCCLILPLGVYLNFSYHRTVLHRALDYVYTHAYTDPACNVDRGALEKIITSIEKQEEGLQTPYLSNLYNTLVFDNLILEEKKRETLKQIFFGAEYTPPSTLPRDTREDEFELRGLEHSSAYQKEGEYWISTLDLTILNRTNFRNEYITTFTLPPGAFISGYYLEIEGVKKQGLVAEKKAALWVYRRIVETRRDPGLLYYNEDGSLSLHVFPFMPEEIRRTGLEIIHPEAFTLRLEGKNLSLGTPLKERTDKGNIAGNVIYIPGYIKQQLPAVARTPVYHFVIDCSLQAKPDAEKIHTLTDGFLRKQEISPQAARVHLVDFTYQSLEYTADWQTELSQRVRAGGFFLERVAGNILLDHYTKPTYPVIVLISPRPEQAILSGSLRHIIALIPETEYLYHLQRGGSLAVYTFSSTPAFRLRDDLSGLQPPAPVVLGQSAGTPAVYLKAGAEPALVYLPGVKNINPEAIEKNKGWKKAAWLWGLWQARNLDPSDSARGIGQIFRLSVEERILSPLTSFIVLENKAQELALLEKQKQTLAGKEYFATEQTPLSMSEPRLLLLLGAVLLFLVIRKVKGNRKL